MGKTYTKKEKAAAIKRLKSGESASVVAREMQIPRSTLLGWKKATDNAPARAKKKRARENASTPSTPSTGENGRAEGASSAKGILHCVQNDKKDVQNDKKDGQNDEGGGVATGEENETSLASKKRKESFSQDSWDNIDKAQAIIKRRLTRALDQESAIDELVDMVLEASDEDLSYQQKQSMLHKLRKIRLDDVRELVVLIGTLYDKQSLANKEATSIVEGGICIEFNIPRPPKQGEDECE